MSEQIIFKIPSQNLEKLNDGLEKLNKKALKLGCSPISTRLISHVTETKVKSHPQNYLILEVIGMAPKLEGGWEFLGTLQHTAAGNILRAVPGKSIAADYRSAAQKCDHCQKVRKRNDTYIVKAEDGRILQVGHNCVKDFLGHNSPANLAFMAEMLNLLSESEDDFIGGDGGSYVPSVSHTSIFMAQAVACVRVDGYVSKSAAKAYSEKSDGGGHLTTTADLTWTQLFPTLEQRNIPGFIYGYTADDAAYADLVLEWVKTLDSASDYNHNVKIACAQKFTTRRESGLVSSAVGAYQKHLGTLKMREKKVNEDKLSSHFGIVGARGEFVLTVMGEHQFETQFGVSTLFRMKDDSGNIAIWFTAAGDMEVGKTYRIKGTVKEHSEYKEIKQTVLSRCKVIAEENVAA